MCITKFCSCYVALIQITHTLYSGSGKDTVLDRWYCKYYIKNICIASQLLFSWFQLGNILDLLQVRSNKRELFSEFISINHYNVVQKFSKQKIDEQENILWK